MPSQYKNIVYPEAQLIAGGDIHVGDVIIQHFKGELQHSILFLRLEKK